MVLAGDRQFIADLKNDTAALTTLNRLHQQIVGCRQPQMLPSLLARYGMAAAARARVASSSTPESGFSTLAAILKAAHDRAVEMINNLKA
jgi:hypothetical protein